MGHRANFVSVGADGWRLHYSHWAASTVCSVVVGGPEAAERFIAAQRRCDEPRPADDWWLDDVWAEGGAAVDHVRRELVFYGDHLMLEVPAKRAFMRLLGRTWPRDWNVRWAYDGIGDLAAQVGVDRSVVRADAPDAREMPDRVETDLTWACHLVTVRRSDGGLSAWPLWQDCHTAWQGPAVLDRLPEGACERLALDAVPESGLNLDVAERVAGVWVGDTAPGLLPALSGLWPGWRVEFWEDRYEEQLARTGGAVTVPDHDPVAELDAVLECLEKRRGRENPVSRMLRTVTGHADGKEVELNPYFTAHQQVEATEEEWARVRAVAAGLRVSNAR